MKTLFNILRKYLPSLNKKRITWRMITMACNKLGAKLYCIPLDLDGYFIPASISASGKPEIYVNSNLSDDLQIATTVHELTHLVSPDLPNMIMASSREEWTVAARRMVEKYNQSEYEACAMGSLSLIPECRLKNASRRLFEVDDEFIEEVWTIRLYLASKDGL